MRQKEKRSKQTFRSREGKVFPSKTSDKQVSYQHSDIISDSKKDRHTEMTEKIL